MNKVEERQELLDAAVEFAREAGALALRYYGGLVTHEDKRDGTPVTIADREAELLIRERIGQQFKDHAVLGEEMEETGVGGRVRWILDPIDATRAFMHGVPFFGVLIGIDVDGETVVGVSHFPALQETVAAAKGLGCTWNGVPCHVSKVDRIEDALVLTTDVERVLGRPEGAGYRRLQKRARFARTWGDCYGHALVATGRAEVMVDPVMKSWDAGPFLTIATEAGGRFTTREGEATIHGGSGISTNGLLHEEVLGELQAGGGPV
jgi:histidinol phosphatase-like enzyme (inositol monophosphatase family)